MQKYEDIIDILNNSQVFRVANLTCFSTRSDLYVTFKEMEQGSKVFKAKIYKLNNKLIIKSFDSKTYFSYEYSIQNDLSVEAIILKTFNETIEILSTTSNEKNMLSINITDNKKSNTVISLEENSLILILNRENYSEKINIDLCSKDVVNYQEKKQNLSFTFNLYKAGKKLKLRSHSNDGYEIILPERKYIAKDRSTIHDNLNSFFYNEHIQDIIKYTISFISERLPYSLNEIRKFKIYNDLELSKNKPIGVKSIISEINKRKSPINNIINSNNVNKLEEKNQKQLCIKK